MRRSVEIVKSAPIEAVFVDVGGTLWPNTWPSTPEVRANRARALDLVLGMPGAGARVLAAVGDEIEEGIGASIDEPVDALIGRVLASQAHDGDAASVRRVRQALCVGIGEVVAPYAGAGELLHGIHELGARCIIVSNTTFRDAEIYGHDFQALGWSRWIDDCITSVDVGAPKPDEHMFEAALACSGAAPRRGVMVGNSERADIAPAVRLGMRTILVAIEEPPPLTTSAETCVTGLPDVLDVLRRWHAESTTD